MASCRKSQRAVSPATVRRRAVDVTKIDAHSAQREAGERERARGGGKERRREREKERASERTWKRSDIRAWFRASAFVARTRIDISPNYRLLELIGGNDCRARVPARTLRLTSIPLSLVAAWLADRIRFTRVSSNSRLRVYLDSDVQRESILTRRRTQIIIYLQLSLLKEKKKKRKRYIRYIVDNSQSVLVDNFPVGLSIRCSFSCAVIDNKTREGSSYWERKIDRDREEREREECCNGFEARTEGCTINSLNRKVTFIVYKFTRFNPSHRARARP